MLNVGSVEKMVSGRWRLRWYEQVTSTNDLALQAARAGEPEGLVAGAETQTRGRGRIGRPWIDVPGGSLLFSILLRPPPNAPRHLLGLAAAVSVAAAAGRFSAALGLRWPNDLYWRGRKVCGILTEAIGEAAVVGIGINVSGAEALPPQLNAADISTAAGAQVSREQLLAAVLNCFDVHYAHLCGGNPEAVITAARAIDDLAGRQVIARRGLEELRGRCLGIDERGRLLLSVGGTTIALNAGEIVYVCEV